MSVQSFKDKAREISYALIRVAFYVKRNSLRSRLEALAVELLENSSRASVDDSPENLKRALADVSSLDGLVRLGHSIYEIEPVNATILVRELDSLNSAIRQSGKLDEELPDLETFFVIKDSETKQEINNSQETNNDLLFNSESKSEVRSNGNGLNSAIRQSAIINKIKSSNDSRGFSQGMRLKDVLAAFPEVSERTLRYDLQKLCERGAIERVGNGGPASYYNLREELLSQESQLTKGLQV